MTEPAVRELPAVQRLSATGTAGRRLPAAGRFVAVPADELPPVYTIAEAARVLRVPEGWLRKKVTAGTVPHTRLGKHVRFTANHLRQIIAAGEQAPATPPATVGSGLSPRARRPRPVA